MVKRDQSDALALRPAAFKAMNDTSTYQNNRKATKHIKGKWKRQDSQYLRQRNSDHPWVALSHFPHPGQELYFHYSPGGSRIAPKTTQSIVTLFTHRKLITLQLTSRCSSLSTYWRSSPPPPALSRRPLLDVMHRCSTGRRSMAPTPFLGHLPLALPSTPRSHKLRPSLSPAL